MKVRTYYSERRLSHILFACLGMGIGTFPALFLVGLVKIDPWPPSYVFIGTFFGSFIGCLGLIWILNSARVEWIEITEESFVYPVYGRFGVYRRPLDNKHISIRPLGSRFVRVRFGWGLPYVFPRYFRRGEKRNLELSERDGKAYMISPKGMSTHGPETTGILSNQATTHQEKKS